MTDYTQPTTELEAVNTITAIIGETPVDTLTGELPADAEKALQLLRDTSRRVQARGWHFNTEDDYPLVRNGANEIPLPANTLRIDSVGEDLLEDVVQRGTRLYDRRNHAYTFSKNLKGSIVLLLGFEELPQAARDYITVRAARRFQAGAMGSPTLDAFAAEDEGQALLALEHAEAATEDCNILTDSLDVAAIWSRRGGTFLG